MIGAGRFRARAAQARRREPGLVGPLLAGAAILAAAFAIVLPMMQAREAAREAAARAQADLDWVRLQLARLPPEASAPRAEPIGLAGLERGLEAAGLRDGLARMVSADDGSIDIDLTDVPWDRLAPWLEAVETAGGYGIERLEVAAGAPGQVSMQLRLSAARPGAR